MDEKELRELFCDLFRKGWQPMLCDTEIPQYETRVPCGNPAQCANDLVETVLMPRQLLSMHPEFMLPVVGDSMQDAGIVAGDMVKVMCGVESGDGDVVLAYIDGEYTLKSYCMDEDGHCWLVPQNEKYKPVRIDEEANVRICGVVKAIEKAAPRVPYKKCIEAIRRAKLREVKDYRVSEQCVSSMIRGMAPKVKKGRHWYAVYRAMADKCVVRELDFDSFCARVRLEVPQHSHLPTTQEMRRMAVLSFAKPISKWRVDNAPVRGKSFTAYLHIAQQALEMMQATS